VRNTVYAHTDRIGAPSNRGRRRDAQPRASRLCRSLASARP
jgi:hypothetical protein